MHFLYFFMLEEELGKKEDEWHWEGRNTIPGSVNCANIIDTYIHFIKMMLAVPDDDG